MTARLGNLHREYNYWYARGVEKWLAFARMALNKCAARAGYSLRPLSFVNQPVFLRMREGEKNGLAKLARFLKWLGMCNGILAPINCMRA